MNIGETYPIEIEILSPVHINSGRGQLRNNLDFVCGKGTLHVIDIERLLADLPIQNWIGSAIKARLSQLLKPEEYKRYARYSLKEPADNSDPQSIFECLKSVHDNPYISGSSLKGAIRTAMAWAMLTVEGIRPDRKDLGYNPRFADDPLMGRLFGTDPNHDLLRSLHISDTQPVSAEEGIEVATVAVYKLTQGEKSRRLEPKGVAFRFSMELLRPELYLSGSVRKDEFLLDKNQSRRLGFDRRVDYVRHFPRHCNAFAEALINKERAFFAQHGVPKISQFYAGLEQRLEKMDKERECLLQISWGTGWTAKTIGAALGEETLAAARDQFSLGYKREPIFPKTRRLVERGHAPEAVMGWIRLKLLNKTETTRTDN